MIGVPIQCHSTNLQLAFDMDTAEQYISYSRAKFIKQLMENAFTNEILKYTLSIQLKITSSTVKQINIST